jgi:TonB family protein
MWQFAMNFPADRDRRIDPGNGGIRRADRFITLACFAALAVLHIAVLSVFDFFEKSERPLAERGELFITLDFADRAPEEPAAAPEAAPAAVSLPQEEAASPEPVPEAIPSPPEESGIASQPETALPGAESFPALSAHGDAAPSDSAPSAVKNRAMTDADYLALILGRLEKNKIYPLSVRKRGIEGDIMTAFTIKQDGTVSGLRLADPSGHRFLAQAAFETIRSASPFPVMEGHEGDYTVQVSIRYRLDPAGSAGTN